MSFALRRDKELPEIPAGENASSSSVELKGLEERVLPSSSEITTPASTNKVLPAIKVEDTLSAEQMDRLYEIWNEAGLTARAHRRRHRNQKTSRRIPTSIAIPDRQDMAISSSADPLMTSGVPRTEESRRRWAFLSAKGSSDTQESEKKPSALKVLRAMAQDRLKKKIRCAKSSPNLSERVTRSSVAPICVVTVPKDGVACGSSVSSPSESASPKVATPPPEDEDENAIYFTLDPDSRFSQGSVRFQPITPIPGSTTAFGRPDSPLLHRHHSLDQLSFATQQAAKTSGMGLPLEYPGDEVFRLIDEMQTYLEF